MRVGLREQYMTWEGMREVSGTGFACSGVDAHRAVPQVATIVPRVLRDTSLVSRVASSSMTVGDLKSTARDV